MFYNKSFIQNNLLKCDQCSQQLNEHDQPKYLPCYKTICSKCELTIITTNSKAIDNKFKCNICEKDHSIPNEGFVLNDRIYALITAEPMRISFGKEYDALKSNLNKIESLIKSLELTNTDKLIDIIKEHCMEQINLIQLSTEKKIEQLNKLNEQFIGIVKHYETKCVQSVLFQNKNESVIRVQMNKLVEEANLFLIEKQAYLDELKINEDEMKQFNFKSEDLQSRLNKESAKLNHLIFDSKLIRFISNTNEMNKFELGIIDYEQLGETTVIIISFKLGLLIEMLKISLGLIFKNAKKSVGRLLF